MACLSFISAGLLALSSQTALALAGAVDVEKATTNNLRGVNVKTINDADATTIKPKAVSEMSSQILPDEEPKTSSLERSLDNDESIFSPDFEVIPSPRIVNGGRATRDRFPYYVSIYTDSWWGPPSHSCGGSLIAPDVVLCAGEHLCCDSMILCFDQLEMYITYMRVTCTNQQRMPLAGGS